MALGRDELPDDRPDGRRRRATPAPEAQGLAFGVAGAGTGVDVMVAAGATAAGGADVCVGVPPGSRVMPNAIPIMAMIGTANHMRRLLSRVSDGWCPWRGVTASTR